MAEGVAPDQGGNHLSPAGSAATASRPDSSPFSRCMMAWAWPAAWGRGDHDDSLAEFGVEALQEFEDVVGGFPVEVAGGFVGDDQVGSAISAGRWRPAAAARRKAPPDGAPGGRPDRPWRAHRQPAVGAPPPEGS